MLFTITDRTLLNGNVATKGGGESLLLSLQAANRLFYALPAPAGQKSPPSHFCLRDSVEPFVRIYKHSTFAYMH